MPIKKTASFALKALGASAIGGAAGFTAGGFTAESEHKASSARDGALVGALTGGAIGIGGQLVGGAGANVLRSAYGGVLKLSRKIGKNPGFVEGNIINAVAKSARKGTMTFRRIRGRLVPIRMK